MRQILIGVFLIPLLTLAQNNVGEQSGFGNYVFGTSPREYKGLTLEIDEGGTKLYTAYSPVKVDGVEFDQVSVAFLHDKLCTIAVKTKNSTGNKFLSVLKQTYGAPGKSNPAIGNYEWKNNKLHLVFEKSDPITDACASFYSVDAYKAEKKK